MRQIEIACPYYSMVETCHIPQNIYVRWVKK
uniref:Uncharacterized protein n=1 Tax=Arundo donax TaxID=35708 RepID=A0A0A9AN53_ARUDO